MLRLVIEAFLFLMRKMNECYVDNTGASPNNVARALTIHRKRPISNEAEKTPPLKARKTAVEGENQTVEFCVESTESNTGTEPEASVEGKKKRSLD